MRLDHLDAEHIDHNQPSRRSSGQAHERDHQASLATFPASKPTFCGAIRSEALRCGSASPFGLLERWVSRRLARKGADGKISGGVWRPPKRAPASPGRDSLAVDLQNQGFTFDEARGIVGTIFAAMTEALKRGEEVDTPLGKFEVKPSPEPRNRVALGKIQSLYQRRKRVVFRAYPDLAGGGDLPKTKERKSK